MELAASRNSITIRWVSFGHVRSNIAFQLFKEAIMHHETSQETTVGMHKGSSPTQAIASLKEWGIIQGVSWWMHKQRSYFNKDCVQAFKDGKHVHLYIFLTLWEQGKWDNTPPLTLPLIERLVKAFKTHRTEIDFDTGCVNGFVKVLSRA